MIGMIRRAIERRRATREMVERLTEQLEAGAWKHARDRANAVATGEDRAFWRGVLAHIEARDDFAARTSVARRAHT